MKAHSALLLVVKGAKACCVRSRVKRRLIDGLLLSSVFWMPPFALGEIGYRLNKHEAYFKKGRVTTNME
jgi:hypothetical protein